MGELTHAQRASARFMGMTDAEYLEHARLLDLGRDTLLSIHQQLLDVISQMGEKRPGRFSQRLDDVLSVVEDSLRCGDCAAASGELHTPGCGVERCKLCGWQAISCDCNKVGLSTVWTGLWPGQAERREYGYADLNELAAACARGELRWDRDQERWVK